MTTKANFEVYFTTYVQGKSRQKWSTSFWVSWNLIFKVCTFDSYMVNYTINLHQAINNRIEHKNTEKEDRHKLTLTVRTASFSKESKWWERVVYASEAKKFEFLVHLDRFSKFLKYFKYFEKRSKWTKNSDFFASEAYTTLSHHFEPS